MDSGALEWRHAVSPPLERGGGAGLALLRPMRTLAAVPTAGYVLMGNLEATAGDSPWVPGGWAMSSPPLSATNLAPRARPGDAHAWGPRWTAG